MSFSLSIHVQSFPSLNYNLSIKVCFIIKSSEFIFSSQSFSLLLLLQSRWETLALNKLDREMWWNVFEARWMHSAALHFLSKLDGLESVSSPPIMHVKLEQRMRNSYARAITEVVGNYNRKHEMFSQTRRVWDVFANFQIIFPFARLESFIVTMMTSDVLQ